MAEGIGRTRWACDAGHLPDCSSGCEPDFCSRDELCLLNAEEESACAEVTFFHADRDPVGPCRIEAPLGVPYGLVVECDRPVVVQLKHVDTRQAELGVTITSGLAGDR